MHYHTGIDSMLIYGISAWLFFNLLRIGGGLLVKRGGATEHIGKSILATV